MTDKETLIADKKEDRKCSSCWAFNSGKPLKYDTCDKRECVIEGESLAASCPYFSKY